VTTALSPEEADVIHQEIREIRQVVTGRRPSFPFLTFHGLVARRMRRKGFDLTRSTAADLLLEWSRRLQDTRLVVYVPLVAVMGEDLPEALGHARRVVERHDPFETWLIKRLKTN
jgi:hypothetical protein